MSQIKVRELSAAQQDRLTEFRDRWRAIGLSTEPANRPLAEQSIITAYRGAGLDPPRKIVWCGSPLSQGLTRAIILNETRMANVRAILQNGVWASTRKNVVDNVGESVGESVRGIVRASALDSVRNSVRKGVLNSVGNSIGDSVMASVWGSVRNGVLSSVGDGVWKSVRAWDSVRDSIVASVGSSVWSSSWASTRNDVLSRVLSRVGNSVRDSIWDSGYGQHDAIWLASYEYFRVVCGLTKETEGLVGLIEQAKHAGWYLPHANICWVSERHNLLELDARGRLHSTSGPAVAYPDGWKIYAIHGVRVAEHVVLHPEQLTVPEIEREKNAEVRRVMMDRFGLYRFLRESNAKEIHNDEYGTLYRKELQDDEPIVMVRVANSTPEPDGTRKEYFLRVPPNMTRAKEAVAWTFGKEEQEYQPGTET